MQFDDYQYETANQYILDLKVQPEKKKKNDSSDSSEDISEHSSEDEVGGKKPI